MSAEAISPISVAVEGPTDEAVALRLLRHVGGVAGPVYGKQGKSALRNRIGGYAAAARFTPWFVMVDLDRSHECAAALRNAWEVPAAPLLCFRVAVREAEAWLLADPQALAQFLGVRQGRLPADPESLNDPKRTLIDIARHSSRRAMREDLIPRPGSGRPVGPGYLSRVMQFVNEHWRPDVAARRVNSLQRTIRCLRSLLGTTIDR